MARAEPSKTMSEYNQEQTEAIIMVREHLQTQTGPTLSRLRKEIKNYLAFRKDVDRFLKGHFSDICTEFCYRSDLSACCSREGIITFFADAVINVLVSGEDEIDTLLQVLHAPNQSLKCVYLGEKGCLWKVKPIVCELFLCKHARESVFGKDTRLKEAWERLERRAKRYTWPNRPVLFDNLEAYFKHRGYVSSLMYCHNSPGLLRVKALAKKQRKTPKQEEGT